MKKTVIKFPSFRYHETLGSKLVNSEEESEALGKGWFDTPAGFKKSKEVELAEETAEAIVEEATEEAPEAEETEEVEETSEVVEEKPEVVEEKSGKKKKKILRKKDSGK